MRTVIFDLDGTLADTSRDLIDAGNSALASLGLGTLLTHESDGPMAMTGGGRAMLRAGLERAGRAIDPDQIEKQYVMFLDAYRANIARHTALYPGVLEALDALLAAGYRTGICTNKPAALAEELLQRLGVRARFGSLVGADTLPVRKPDPAPLRLAVARAGGDVNRTVLVGDSDTDRKCARAAGTALILVRFGPQGDAVEQLEPDAMIDRYDALAATVAGLIG